MELSGTGKPKNVPIVCKLDSLIVLSARVVGGFSAIAERFVCAININVGNVVGFICAARGSS